MSNHRPKVHAINIFLQIGTTAANIIAKGSADYL
jgi:hypothetical protein